MIAGQDEYHRYGPKHRPYASLAFCITRNSIGNCIGDGGVVPYTAALAMLPTFGAPLALAAVRMVLGLEVLDFAIGLVSFARAQLRAQLPDVAAAELVQSQAHKGATISANNYQSNR